ncbi:unnamed protein product, partial [Darwinula stevensoni]
TEPPKFTVKPENVTRAVLGQKLMLNCQAHGDPEPTIQWDKDGYLNGYDHRRIRLLGNGSLWFEEVVQEDQGLYGCTAGNSGGFNRVDTQLLVTNADGEVLEGFGKEGTGSPDPEEMGGSGMMTKTVSITLGAAGAYILLVLGLMVWCRCRRIKRKQAYLQVAQHGQPPPPLPPLRPAKSENGDIHAYSTIGHEMKGLTLSKEAGKSDGDTAYSQSSSHSQSHAPPPSGTSGLKTSSASVSHASTQSSSSLHLSRQDLQTLMPLGKGEFGDVFLAKVMHGGEKIDGGGGLVMVKALQNRDENAVLEFRHQAELYGRLQHPHMARLLALCRDAFPHLMVMEYSDWGDLKQFLLATRKDRVARPDAPKPPPLTIAQAIRMAQQISCAMEHMANHRFVHKDIATRNCLISSTLDIKISNPSLCRDTYCAEYCQLHNQLIPLRWMPHEAVFEDEHSTKSDVWAWACCVWEIFHQGELPYHEYSDDAVLHLLRKQELCLRAPHLAPEPLGTLLETCWSASPRDRPSFGQIVSQLHALCLESGL